MDHVGGKRGMPIFLRDSGLAFLRLVARAMDSPS
jgi:hypothetical protein